MAAEKQYLELFEQQRSLVDANSAAVMNAVRENACSVLQDVGVARTKDFSVVDPEQLLAVDYALNLARHHVPTDVKDLFTCAVPEVSTHVHYMVNEQYEGYRGPHDLPEGVFCGSLRTFCQTHPAEAARYYHGLAGTSALHDGAGEVALNTMFAQDGFCLYVPDGVQIDRPIQLISLMRGVVDVLACQRVLVIVGERAKAHLLMCEHASRLTADSNQISGEHAQLLSLQVTEVYVGKGGLLDFYSLEEHHASAPRLGHILVRQEAESNLALGVFTLQAAATRNRVTINLVGEGAETHLFGMVVGDHAQRVDNITRIDHQVPGCKSDELFKYILDGEARGGFIGRIHVAHGAVQTEAYQTNRNLCLTTQSRMMSRPELEIYADDVKCSHGATVGQLDQNALYYMQTRGIPAAEARLLLMIAFMGDVIDNIRIEPLKERLKYLVEKRLRGELGRCKGCSVAH